MERGGREVGMFWNNDECIYRQHSADNCTASNFIVYYVKTECGHAQRSAGTLTAFITIAPDRLT